MVQVLQTLAHRAHLSTLQKESSKDNATTLITFGVPLNLIIAEVGINMFPLFSGTHCLLAYGVCCGFQTHLESNLHIEFLTVGASMDYLICVLRQGAVTDRGRGHPG